ncbi:MAG: hypothetical protein KJ000_22410 [Pirellulaceae bacterium]|nr:hypothetical protein [Pirellulaceae bacterium]
MNDRVEIRLETEAAMNDVEKKECEQRIREALTDKGLDVEGITFQDGSTIITVSLLVASGLGFVFVHVFGAACKKFGEKVGEKIGDYVLGKHACQEVPQHQQAITPVSGMQFELLDYAITPEGRVQNNEDAQDFTEIAFAARRSGESIYWILATELPGERKTLSAYSKQVNPHTGDIEEAYYKKQISR